MNHRSELDAPPSQLVGVRQPRDINYWGSFQDILDKYPHSTSDILHHWPIYVRRANMTRFLAHYEIFRQALDVPGSIVEVGISRGISYFTWIKLVELFLATDTSVKVFGFDNFKGLDDFCVKDGKNSLSDDKQAGGWAASGKLKEEFYMLLSLINEDGILAKNRGIVYEGDLTLQLGSWADDYPGCRLSMIHIDVDLYEPTKQALDALWDHLVPGGIIVFDEYGLPPWKGETQAWDDFQAERGLALVPQKVRGSFTPSAYFVKH